MKRTLLLFILIVALFNTASYAATPAETYSADALHSLGLFLGTDKGYELDSNLTRAQGVVLLVRMMGKEQEATTQAYTPHFTDVPDWAACHVEYALANGITNGVSETHFDPDGSMTDYMFLTLILRALGYSDSEQASLFVWNDPYDLAYSLRLVDSTNADDSFSRGDAVSVFWNALDVEFNGEQESLGERLIAQGVFTQTEFSLARNIYENGYPVDDTESNTSSDVSVPTTPTPVVPIPNIPETDTDEDWNGDDSNDTDSNINSEEFVPSHPNQTPTENDTPEQLPNIGDNIINDNDGEASTPLQPDQTPWG